MKRILVTALILFIVFLAASPFREVSGQYVLPKYDKAVGYVRTLIDSYNALVKNSTYINRPDFNCIKGKGNLSLYHEEGHSFQVVVLQSVPTNASYVALIFAPIRANQPNVTMDYNDTFTSVFPHAITIAAEYGLLEKNTVSYGSTTIQIPLIFVVLSTDISGDYLTNAKNAAQYIYQQDTKQIPSHLAFCVTLSETIGISAGVSTLTPADPNFVPRYLTLTITTTQTTTAYVVTTSQDEFSWFYENPIVKIIDSIFGSVIEFASIIIAIIIIVVKRRKVKSELKRVLHIDSPHRDKPKKAKS